jgi:hypothetical protein
LRSFSQNCALYREMPLRRAIYHGGSIDIAHCA